MQQISPKCFQISPLLETGPPYSSLNYLKCISIRNSDVKNKIKIKMINRRERKGTMPSIHYYKESVFIFNKNSSKSWRVHTAKRQQNLKTENPHWRLHA